MKLLRLMYGVTKENRIINEYISGSYEVKENIVKYL